jgi:hypothetical protein
MNVEDQTTLLVKHSEEVLKGLTELHLFSDQSHVDISASKTRSPYIGVFYGATSKRQLKYNLRKCKGRLENSIGSMSFTSFQ